MFPFIKEFERYSLIVFLSILSFLLLSCFSDLSFIYADTITFPPYKKANGRLEPSFFLKEKQDPKPFIILNSAWSMGFFGDFLTALGALHLYEQGIVAGVSIEYGTGGSYYESTYGQNWWEYYFEPVHVGSQENTTLIPAIQAIYIHDHLYDLPRLTEFNIYRKDAYALIKKYIHVKPHIKKKVRQVIRDSFGSGKVIGVHYRGTDKFMEVPLASFESVASYIDEAIAQLTAKEASKVKIFVATDQQSFIDYMSERYPSKVTYYKEGTRSMDGQPLHLSSLTSNYKKGEDALIDCLLLSKSDMIIKTSSNLSLCAAYFNPRIPMVHVTVRDWHSPLE